MRSVDSYVSREHRFWLGRESDSGRHYLSIPVSNGVVDCEDYCALGPERYHEYIDDPLSALPFAEECRQRQHDDRLIQTSGRNRGTPV